MLPKNISRDSGTSPFLPLNGNVTVIPDLVLEKD